jgi:hypothetical protein
VDTRVIEQLEELIEIDLECVLKNQRVGIIIAILSAHWEFLGGRWVSELATKECGFAYEEMTMYFK